MAFDLPCIQAASKPDTKSSSSSVTTPAVPSFPPPKSDKPRPHVCTTCMRSFARLEHLKRHERSHTKEKPFECPSCTRCFARRDLLLRHQQKLHSTTTPSSRPRAGRRESTTGVATGRVRKNSVASTSTTTSMRPRANTMSHVDTSSTGLMMSGHFARQFAPMHSHHSSFSGISGNTGFGFRNIGPSSNTAAGLARLDTNRLHGDLTNGLRSAPPYGGFGAEFEMGGMGFEQDGGDTINPHALHMHNMSAFSMENSWESAQHMYSGMPTSQSIAEDDGFDWMTQGFENQMTFTHGNENAIDDSSPSAMSTNSPANFHDTANNPTNMFMDNTIATTMWQQPLHNGSQLVHSPIGTDTGTFFYDIGPLSGDTVSPKSLARKSSVFEHNFPTPPEMLDHVTTSTMSNGGFTLPFKHDNVASTASTSSVDSSLRQSSVTTSSSELVNDQMRNTLLAGLSQCPGFGHRKLSQPAISSPLSPMIATIVHTIDVFILMRLASSLEPIKLGSALRCNRASVNGITNGDCSSRFHLASNGAQR